MGLELGIVGLPNVGKSTLFKAVTRAPAEAANYPFCTIDPNIGVVALPDERLLGLANIFNPKKIIPNVLSLTDIAGLVKGAASGEGLGNNFLDHIRRVNAVAHLVRCFDDDNVIHVDGSVDPQRDIDIIKTELILSDIVQVERKRDKAIKNNKGKRNTDNSVQTYRDLLEHLELGKLVLTFPQKEDECITELNLITAKPFFYVINVSETQLNQETDYEKTVRKIAEEDQVKVLKICCSLEAELADMEPEEQQILLKDVGVSYTGLGQIVREGFRLLHQISFFTAGPQEVRAWNAIDGSLAPQAAGKIHSDMERGFIRTEVFHYNDIIEHGSEQAVKESGKLRVEGKDYCVQDGDIMHIRFNV